MTELPGRTRRRSAASVLPVAIAMMFSLLSGTVSAGDDPYDLALGHYREGRYLEAIDALSRKQTPGPGDLGLLGWAYLKSGDATAAKDRFERSIALEPGASDPHCGLGYVFLRWEDLERAREWFDIGISLDGGNVDCLTGKGMVLEESGDRPGALAAYDRVLSIDRDNRLASEKISLLSRMIADAKRTERIAFFARGDYFWISADSTPPEPIFVKGVNLGFALPGRFPTGFPDEEEAYLDWFRRIREMNANLIRVYTILPPEFYRAVKRFNADRSLAERLFVIQGIWAELPGGSDFDDPAYASDVKREIANAVDVVHGAATIPPIPGHAHGTYEVDISDSVLAFIFGREWEPPEVVAYSRRRGVTAFAGNYLSVSGANPMEVWLTGMLDFLVSRERERYGTDRPVAWMNWPPLDPLHHRSEASFLEELAYRRKQGEILSGVDESRIWDEDAVSVDETRIKASPAFRGGLFSSYHVYPYYPDFLRNEEKYAGNASPGSSDRYAGYLRDLKAHYRGIPLLISEYGVPTSRGIARYHPEGMHHGGLNETEQADVLIRLTRSIRETGCAGGVVFSWIDEWVKSNWMVRGMEERDPLWFNAQDPEESYGLMAVLPARTEMLKGDRSAWSRATEVHVQGAPSPLVPLRDGADGARRLIRLAADADAGYLYLRLDVAGTVDWENAAYAIAINTTGTEEGGRLLPLNLAFESRVGFQYVVLLHGKRSRLLIDDEYNRIRHDPNLRKFPGLTGYAEKEHFSPLTNREGRFTEIVTTHRRRFSRDGTVFPERAYNASILREGNVSDDSLADFLYNPEIGAIEIRIPWNLLNVADPSRLRIIYSDRERRTTEGLRFLVASYKPRGKDDSVAADLREKPNITDLMPRNPEDIALFRWQGWETPEYVMRPKRSYQAMKDVFSGIGNPDVTIRPPRGFDFTSVVRNHYGAAGEFRDLYRAIPGNGADIYGGALANLVKGLTSNEPFFVLEAKTLFLAARGTSPDEREREIARLGAEYADRLLSGEFGRAGVPADPPGRIVIRKEDPPDREYRRIVLGKSAIRLGGKGTIHTQVDRVTRDWLSATNADAPPRTLAAGTVVPWHEGEKIREILDHAPGQAVSPVWGTKARKIGNVWYAPDAAGIFRFALSEDKVVNYPANIVIDEDTVLLNDTHGISAVAWDSAGADLVIGCGDHEGKTDAAYSLAERGVDVYMPTDRYIGRLIGARTRGTILGSAPVKRVPGGAVIGDQPVVIDVGEPVVVSTSDGRYPLQYYDAPHRYFRALAEYLRKPMKITPVEVTEYGKGEVVVAEARRTGANLIGIRVWGKEEHDAVSAWLAEDPDRRAVLFHSAVYPEGYRLFFEFPRQTTFGDVAIHYE